MRESGSVRFSFVGVMGIVGVLIVAFLLFFSREGLTSVGGRFMAALAKGDVDTLTKMSYASGKSEEQLRKEWDFAVNKAGKYYRFRYVIDASTEHTDKSGAVRMRVIRNAETMSSYDEVFQLPMVKDNGTWKVDVRGISRDMFPALPR